MISVLILTRNRPEIVKKCVLSIKQQTMLPDEIIILENGSVESLRIEQHQEIFKNCKIYRISDNIGCPQGRNYLINLSKGDYLFFVDDDGELEKHAIENCMKYFTLYKNIGVVTFRIIDPVSGKIRDGITTQYPFYHHTFGGGSCCIKRSVFDKVGMFPTEYPRQGEEHDIAVRLIDVGYDILYAPDCILYHSDTTLFNESLIYSVLSPITTAWRFLPYHYAIVRTIVNTGRLLVYKKINMKIWKKFKIVSSAIQYGLSKRSPISFKSYIRWLRLLKGVKNKMHQGKN